MKGSVTLSTSAAVSLTFTVPTSDIQITDANFVITGIYTDIFGVYPSGITKTTDSYGWVSSVTVTFPAYSSASSMNVILEFDHLYN